MEHIEQVKSDCRHRFKIHETYYAHSGDMGTFMDKRATVVCEKCARVKDIQVEVCHSINDSLGVISDKK